ncbi:hypothetical protein ENBRE01_3195, partial [Enteropsectra breve]
MSNENLEMENIEVDGELCDIEGQKEKIALDCSYLLEQIHRDTEELLGSNGFLDDFFDSTGRDFYQGFVEDNALLARDSAGNLILKDGFFIEENHAQTGPNISLLGKEEILHESRKEEIREREELLEKMKIGATSRGKIIIEDGVFKTYVYMHQNDAELLYAKRTLTGFNIYSSKNKSLCLAHLRANIFGTKYSMDDLLGVKYETSFLQRGRPRSFAIELENMQLINKQPYYNNDT